ncbi:MAG TPA: DUF2142 domain-containing protein [Candidatus Tectomicrobia bacterium]|nr:DUF2142 domain-containing protein [Candidatus Tectomicrobia bacterium]
MASAESKSSRNEHLLISFLCVAAALRVFIFSAAFPFFSNIDEDLHFDLIMQYSDVQIPRSFDRLKEETLNWIVPYASPEFLFSPERFPHQKFPAPLWKEPWSKVEREIAATRAAWSSEINFQSSQPPLYYALASAWWWIGKHLGLAELQSLYWIRFLNVPLVAMMVWLAYVTARIIAPERMDLRIGVPLLVAFIPQNVFYAMNNDVLSPLCFGAVFLCMLQWLRTNAPGFSLGALTGLAVAATCLTKLSNLPLVAVVLAVVVARSIAIILRTPRTGLIALAALISCAAIPVGTWLLWIKFHFGDFTGSTAKISLLGWTRKPFGDWWQHPIFTPRGVWTFWADLIGSLWRGEVSWHGRPLRWRGADGFYTVSSLLLFAAAAVGLRKQTGLSPFQRQAIGSAILTFLGGVVFLALLSIQFDFGNCINPSREHPYFTSGRLLSGALIPFVVVYVYAVSWILRRINTALPLVVLGLVVVFMTTSEILVDRVVFLSEHNWFHR